MSSVKNIVLTGGPCAGKTSSLVFLTEKLAEKGFLPLIVPEAATMFFGSSVSPTLFDEFELQKLILQLQLQNEKFFGELAERCSTENRKTVLIHDRGILDGAAYLSGDVSLEKFQEGVLLEEGLPLESVRSMYDGIIHLVTAADGAEEFYTLGNNGVRKESPEEARQLDQRTQRCWLGHGHISLIQNRDESRPISFKEKKERVLHEVLSILGMPLPIELEDKYLLVDFDPKTINVPFEAIEIEQYYLKTAIREDGWEERIRKRTWGGFSSYVHTQKRPAPHNDEGRIEVENPIRFSEFSKLMSYMDPKTRPITKTRYCFLFEGQYFEVDVMRGDLAGRFYAERQKTHVNSTTVLPPFLHVAQEVTGEEEHSMAYLAAH